MSAYLGFNHEFVAGSSDRTLLLLHGTGGNEHDLIPLGRYLDPEAALLSPRGQVLEHGMPRFFRRLAEGIFDEKDLISRTNELADFLRQAAAHYGFDQQKLTAELDEYIKRKYEEMSHDRRLRLKIHKFVRLHPESDEVSREIDFSPERINTLIHQGRTEASRILAASFRS